MSLKTLLFNVRSIINLQKRLRLADYALKHDFDLILLTETWLTKDIENSELLLSNYEIFRANRSVGENEISKHGGCLIALKKTLSGIKVNLGQCSKALEDSFVAIKLVQPNPIYIAVLYNPPSDSKYRLSTKEVQELFTILNKIRQMGKTILVGDFNLPGVDWGAYSSDNDYESLFIDGIISANLKQVVDFNTTDASCLDLASLVMIPISAASKRWET